MAQGGAHTGHLPGARGSRPALEKPPKCGRCRGPVGGRAPSPPCRVGEGGSGPAPVARGVTGQRGTTAERWRGLTPGNWSPSVRRAGAGGGATGYLRWWLLGVPGPPQPGPGQRRNRAQRGLQELGTLRVPGVGHSKSSRFSVSSWVVAQGGLSGGGVAASDPLAPNPGWAGMAGAGMGTGPCS